MTSEADNLEAQIDQQEKRTKELHHDLDTTVQRLREETIRFASQWTEEAVRKSVVEDNPDHAKQAGEETISKLKEEMTQLVSEMPEHVDRALERVRWPHTREQRPFQSFGGGSTSMGSGCPVLGDKTQRGRIIPGGGGRHGHSPEGTARSQSDEDHVGYGESLPGVSQGTSRRN